jgi:hypothetical protein
VTTGALPAAQMVDAAAFLGRRSAPHAFPLVVLDGVVETVRADPTVGADGLGCSHSGRVASFGEEDIGVNPVAGRIGSPLAAQ